MPKARTALFASYLKTAARALVRDHFYSAFNIAGLAIGIVWGLVATKRGTWI